MPKNRELQKILDNIKRQESKRIPALQAREGKYTETPFGAVWSKLLTLNHTNRLRKGEILAQCVRDKKTGKKERFMWLGVVETSDYDFINCCHKIYYRPFVDQHEHEEKRRRQLYIKQMF